MEDGYRARGRTPRPKRKGGRHDPEHHGGWRGGACRGHGRGTGPGALDRPVRRRVRRGCARRTGSRTPTTPTRRTSWTSRTGAMTRGARRGVADGVGQTGPHRRRPPSGVKTTTTPTLPRKSKTRSSRASRRGKNPGSPASGGCRKTSEQWRRRAVLDAKRPRDKPVHRSTVEIARAVQAVGPCHSREALKVDLLRQPAEGAVAHLRRLVQHAKLEVMRHQPDDLCSHVEAVDRVDVQAMAEARSPHHHRRSRCAAVVSAGRHLVPGTPVELASALALENRRDPSLRRSSARESLFPCSATGRIHGLLIQRSSASSSFICRSCTTSTTHESSASEFRLSGR